MKINLYFSLKNNVISIDYSKFIVSYIKQCLFLYDKELYKKWYEGKNEIKPFTFSVYFNNPVFKGEKIILGNKDMIVYFKMPISEDTIRLYNAFLARFKNKEEFKITDNSMLLTHLYSEVLKEFEDNHLIIKMNSPLISRNHDRQTNKNKYYLATDPEFKETIKMNISNVIERLNLNLALKDFEIKPLKTTKTVVRLYGSMIQGSLGIFEIKGNKKLLNFLYQAGIGSARSSGYGSFSIIK